MSDPVVITAFKSQLQTLTTPYVDTLNTRPAVLPRVFTSLERDHSVVSRVTLGTPTQFREEGVLQVVVNVGAGTGDTDGQTLAEQVRDLFHNYNVSFVFVRQVGSAVTYAPDEGNYFQMKVPVEYQFDFFKP